MNSDLIFGGLLAYLVYGRFYLNLRISKIKPKSRFHENRDTMLCVGILWPFFMAYDYWKI